MFCARLMCPEPMNDSPDAPCPPALPAFGWTHAAATGLARWLARRLFALEVRGLENVPDGTSCLLCANHTSHVDTFAIATATAHVSRRLIFLGARDYFTRMRSRHFLVRKIICLVNFDRAPTAAALKRNLASLSRCCAEGRVIVLFPEGTRSPDGQLATFKMGAALFADRLSVPVVPCRIEGAHASLPKGSWLPRLTRLRVTFGCPVTILAGADGETSGERAIRYFEFSEDLQQRVAQLGDSTALNAAAVPA
jgi:1-acyl-sn-glycerol-3-phosphate acyltransferase